MRDMQSGDSGVPSPYTINGRVVPLSLYVSKEVLIAGVEGGSVDTNAVTERALKGTAEGFAKKFGLP